MKLEVTPLLASSGTQAHFLFGTPPNFRDNVNKTLIDSTLVDETFTSLEAFFKAKKNETAKKIAYKLITDITDNIGFETEHEANVYNEKCKDIIKLIDKY